MTIPIFIINWNGYQDTVECISSLKMMSDQSYHVHLLDNGSDHQEGERLRTLYADDDLVTVTVNAENLGYTDGTLLQWSQIADTTDSDYIALLNNDTEVHPGWLTEMRAFAQKSKADVISSCLVDYADRSILDNTGHFLLSTGEIMPAAHGEPVADHQVSEENWGACAAACFYSTAMLRDIGFFDPFFDTGYEDAELGLRARLTGHVCLYCPEAIVYHKGGASLDKVMNDGYKQKIQIDIFYSYMKLMPMSFILLNAPFFLFKHMAVAVVNLIFLRTTFLKNSVKSFLAIHGKHRATLKQARRNFHSQHQVKSWLYIAKHSVFFLWLDVKRFWTLMIMDRKSKFD